MSAPYADKIVVLDGDGTIKEQGTYEASKLLFNQHAFVLLVNSRLSLVTEMSTRTRARGEGGCLVLLLV